MQPIIPLDIILERMRREHPDARPPIRIHAPPPEPPRLPDPPREEEEREPQRGIAIIDFAV
tara:strand:- start:303 stop:485 length:183 start_codon:yes stop_codon:yes gene_type:complete